MIDPNSFAIPPEQCTLTTCGLEEAQVNYVPSVGGNASFLAVFGLLLILQTVQGIRYRTWGVLVGMAASLILEVVGYLGRVQMHFNPFKSGPFTTQFVCLTLAPAFLSASIYLCLARIIIVEGESYSRFKPRTYSLLFATFDFISLLLQAVGGAFASTADTVEFADKGINTMIAGLAFQILSLLLFMGIWLEYLMKKHKSLQDEKREQTGFEDLAHGSKFNAFKIALWTSTICIFIRSIYRLAELQGGFDSAIANNEPAFMVLEGPLIILAAGALTWFHPGRAFDGRWSAATWSFRTKRNGDV